jgi:O-antigen/teichoic acid export membrane protein
MSLSDNLQRLKALALHSFVRQAVVLQVGSGLATFVQAAAGVLVARILAPEAFGQYSLAFSVASIATLFLGSGAADAIAPQVSRAWAQNDGAGVRTAYGFFTRFMGAAAGLTVLIVLVLPAVTERIYSNGDIGGAAGVVVIASLVSATLFTLTQLSLQLAGRIKALAAFTFADVTVRYGFVLALALASGFYGAVTGHLVGALVVLALVAAVFSRLTSLHTLLPRLRDLPALAKTTPWRPLLKPTLWVMADRNLAMLYGALPVAMVGLYAQSTEIAYFKLAFGYILIAMSLLGPVSTLLNVRFPTLQIADRSRLRPAFVRVTLYAIALSTAATAAVLIVSPWVFRVLYGEAYLPAIPYVYGFGLFGALFGLGVALGPMWRAVDRVHTSIVINLVTLGAGIPLGIWLMTRWHLWGAVAMVTVWYTASHAFSFWYLLRSLGKMKTE